MNENISLLADDFAVKSQTSVYSVLFPMYSVRYPMYTVQCAV